jgi:hypothetical protein
MWSLTRRESDVVTDTSGRKRESGMAGSEQVTDRVLMISSDGHVTARLEDYRPYMPSQHHAFRPTRSSR